MMQVEESYIGAEEFCKVAKQDESVVLRGETILLEALEFDLIVYTPYRPLQGFLLVGHPPKYSRQACNLCFHVSSGGNA